METHAEYDANNPLPICGTIFGCMKSGINPPKEGVGRVHKIPMGIAHHQKTNPPEEKKYNTIRARYLACLSKTKWTTSAEIANAIGVNQVSVTKMMSQMHMKAVTKAKKIDGHKWGWKIRS